MEILGRVGGRESRSERERGEKERERERGEREKERERGEKERERGEKEKGGKVNTISQSISQLFERLHELDMVDPKYATLLNKLKKEFEVCQHKEYNK